MAGKGGTGKPTSNSRLPGFPEISTPSSLWKVIPTAFAQALGGPGLPTHAPRQVPPLKQTSLLSRGVFLRQSSEKIPLSLEVCREMGSGHGSPQGTLGRRKPVWDWSHYRTDENPGSPLVAVGCSPNHCLCLTPLSSDSFSCSPSHGKQS